MTRLHAFGITSLLCLTALASIIVAPTALADEDGTLQVHALDESGPLTDLFGYRGAALINVTDPDLVEPTVTVLATSTSDTTGEDLVLQRLGLFNIGGQATPVYHGILAVEATQATGNGLLWVQDGDTISLVYIDDRDDTGSTVVRQGFVTWHLTHQGSLSLGTGDFRGTDTEADIILNDLDLTTPTVAVNVTSDSQGAPIQLTLDKVTDGLYTGQLGFTPVGSPTPGSVEVASGDRFTVYYRNYGPTGDEQNVTTSGTWRTSYTGRVQFVTSDYRTLVSELSNIGTVDPTDPAVFGVSAATSRDTAGAWLRVEDPDRRGHGTVTVQVGSMKVPSSTPQTNVDPTGRTITLTETGPNTGEFTGHIGFVQDAPSTGSRLRVDDTGDVVIEARYIDPKDAAGTNNVLVKSQVAWFERHTAVPEFLTTGGVAATQYNVSWDENGCGGAGCIEALALLSITDPDLNEDSTVQESVTARLVSSDTVGSSTVLRDALGIDVELQETATDSGVFQATVQFNHTFSNPFPTGHPAGGTYPTIWALCEDSIQLIFVDPAGVDNRPRLVTASVPMAGSADQCTQTAPPVPGGATAPTLKLKTSATSTTTATSFSGYSTPGNPVLVHVELKDDQLNDNAAQAEVTTLRLVASATETYPANWTIPAADALAPIRSEGSVNTVVKLTETGVDTGIFRGAFELVQAGAVAGDVPKVPVVGAGEQSVCATYPHANTTDAIDTVLRSCASWVPFITPAQATDPEFRDALHQGEPLGSEFRGQGRAYIFIRDTDELADPTTGIDQVTVNVRSDSDTEGINVVLTERYGHHYMHNASGNIVDDPCVVTFGGGTGCGNPVADSAIDDRGFLGTFNFSLGASSDATDTLRVRDGDTVTVFYQDGAPILSTTDSLLWRQTYTASLSLDRTEVRVNSAPNHPSNFIEITVNDRDGNITAGLDQITVSATNTRGQAAAVTLNEIDPHAGVFRGKVELCRTAGCTTDSPNARLEFRDEETVTVTYLDVNDAAGDEQLLRQTALARNVTAGKLTLDQTRYSSFSAIGGITLEDKDQDTSANRDEVRVFAWSTSDATGEYIVLRETAANSGVFEGGFGFESTGDAESKRGNGALMVADGDRINVYYLDRNLDGVVAVGPGEPASKRVTATWTLTANVGPVLELTTTPSGNGTILRVAPGTQVTFHLNATDNDGTVASWSLRFGDGTAPASGTGAVPASVVHVFQQDGSYIVRFNATDDEGQQSTVTLTVEVAVPDDDPPGTPTGLTVDQVRADSVRLTWTAPQTNAGAADGDKVIGYEIRRSSGAIMTEAEWDAASPVVATFDPVTLALPGELQRAVVVGLSPATTYTLAVRATDTQNRGPIATVSATTLVQDATPPPGVPTISSSHQEGVASAQRNVTFTWTAVSDPESTVSYRYKWNTQAAQTVVPTDTPTTQTSVTFPAVAPGRYYFHLAACSAGGTLCGSTVTYGPVIIEGTAGVPTAGDIETANGLVQLRVTRDGSDNVVVWTVPTNTPFPIAGVQIWRSTSPYDLVATLERNSEEYQAGRYVDRNAPANATYLVTVFFEVGGQRYGYAASDPSNNIPGFDDLEGTQVQGDGGLEWYWIAAIILAAALVLAIVMVLVVSLRQRDRPEEAWSEQGWPEESAWPEEGAWPEQGEWPEGEHQEAPEDEVTEPAPPAEPWEDDEVADGLPVPDEARPEAAMDEHLLTCPHCHTEFIAAGTKPLVTQCPNCHVKGVLR